MKFAPILLGLISLFFLFSNRIIDLGFSTGNFPLNLKSDPEFSSSNSCGSCHLKQYEEWEESRHHLAYTNNIFQDGLSVENRSECKNCHGPLENNRNEGINCSVCHLRENEILTSSDRLDSSAHSFKKTNIMISSEFCANCHQFNFHKLKEDLTFFSKNPMQNTYEEWKEYIRKTENPQTCQGCHMPNGAHIFRGAHNLDFLRASIRIKTSRNKDQIKLVLYTEGLGHNFPTGDLFRHLTLEIKKGKSDFHLLERIGRIFQTEWNEKTGELTKSLKSDNSLRPGEIRTYEFISKNPIQYRLIFHYTGEKDEERGKLPLDHVIKLIHKGSI